MNNEQGETLKYSLYTQKPPLNTIIKLQMNRVGGVNTVSTLSRTNMSMLCLLDIVEARM